MKAKTKVMQPEVLLEEYRRLLQEDGPIDALPLIITGSSMSPFLIHERDTIFLSRLTRPVHRGDVLLYRRSSGAYVVHRVFKVTPEGFTMVGDAQTVLEPGIQQDQVIAIVTKVVRKGKKLEPGCFWWGFFEKVWIRMIPLRRTVHGLYTRLRRLRGAGRSS